MSTEEIFYISNVGGHTVELPLATAKEQFGMLEMDSVFNAARPENDAEGDVEAGDEDHESDAAADDAPLKVDNLEYSDKVLDVVVRYARLGKGDRTDNIPRPLTQPLKSVVNEAEMALVTDADTNGYLVDLLNCAMFLRFKQLTALCAAYMAMRIDEIAKAAPDIMTGAESIRKFMCMQNEWTEEEMAHLKEEMQYAKSVDPNVY